MADLNGKVALVTGAARYRGIGRAIALRLANDGADMVICGRQRPPDSFPDHEKSMGWQGLESVAEEIRALDRKAETVLCDRAKYPN